MEAELGEDGVDEVVGEVQGELEDGVEALEGEDAAEAVEDGGEGEGGVGFGGPPLVEEGSDGVDRPAAGERSEPEEVDERR